MAIQVKSVNSGYSELNYEIFGFILRVSRKVIVL